MQRYCLAAPPHPTACLTPTGGSDLKPLEDDELIVKDESQEGDSIDAPTLVAAQAREVAAAFEATRWGLLECFDLGFSLVSPRS